MEIERTVLPSKIRGKSISNKDPLGLQNQGSRKGVIIGDSFKNELLNVLSDLKESPKSDSVIQRKPSKDQNDQESNSVNNLPEELKQKIWKDVNSQPNALKRLSINLTQKKEQIQSLRRNTNSDPSTLRDYQKPNNEPVSKWQGYYHNRDVLGSQKFSKSGRSSKRSGGTIRENI